MVWRKHESGPASIYIWAPELHRINGAWYIYFAGAATDFETSGLPTHRMFVLENTDDDPTSDNWVEKGQIDPRDADTCIGYLEHPDSELHQVIGFYGDDERTELHYGAKHWMLDIHNRSGIDALRYVVVENAPHCWPVAAAELSWQFFRQFRRDIATGRIVMDPYQPANN